MTESDRPQRYASGELTLTIPRDQLPPISVTSLAALDLDPEHPETKELAQRAVAVEEDETEDWRTTPTLVPCPAGCGTCICCAGRGMVAADEAALWRIQQVDAKNEPDDAA